MYCTNCGVERPPGATACPACGTGIPLYTPTATVPNHLVQAILVTLCCCLPGGIVALVYSTQVNSKLAAGNVPGAMESSAKAKQWILISFVLGILSFGAGAAISFLSDR